MEVSTPSAELTDMLTEVFHIGVGYATSALSEMLDQLIEMEIPQLYFFTPDSFEKFAQGLKGRYVCVVQRILGDISGLGSLSLPLVEGKTLVDQLLEANLPKQEFGAVETEAIQEVGNIIIHAVGSAFDNVIDFHVQYEAPEVLFTEYPLPYHQLKGTDHKFFIFVNANLRAQTSNIEGLLNMMFAYNDMEVLEKLLRKTQALTHKFGELLVRAHYITTTQLQEALDLQKNADRFIGELLVEQNYITPKLRDTVLESDSYRLFAVKFGEALLKESYVTEEQLARVLETQRLSRSMIGDILIALGHLKEENKNQVLKEQNKILKNAKS
ncbi:hypothetical protein WDW89_11545 [Deltaproteobacteria bacterium TL4]